MQRRCTLDIAAHKYEKIIVDFLRSAHKNVSPNRNFSSFTEITSILNIDNNKNKTGKLLYLDEITICTFQCIIKNCNRIWKAYRESYTRFNLIHPTTISFFLYARWKKVILNVKLWTKCAIKKLHPLKTGLRPPLWVGRLSSKLLLDWPKDNLVQRGASPLKTGARYPPPALLFTV